MLRELITWVLNTYLGKYLENFNSAQLSVALLSGEVELENVPIRKDALRLLGIPIQVFSGTVGKIKLQIPVRQFRTSPWCISIDHIYCVVGPKDLDQWDDIKEKNSELDYKVGSLEAMEAKLRLEKGYPTETYYSSSYNTWLNYGTNLVTNIIDNIELKISDVHLRYEDAVTIGSSFSVGIRISSLTAQSCDNNWTSGVHNVSNQQMSYKLIELTDFSLYWDQLQDDATCKTFSNVELLENMTTVCGKYQHDFIINPISAKAQWQRDKCKNIIRSKDKPRISCEILVPEVKVSLTANQYKEALKCLFELQKIKVLRSYRLKRPENRVLGNTKEWWMFAVACHGFVIKNETEKWLTLRENVRYMRICRRILMNPNENLSKDDKNFKFSMEMKRHLSELKMLRRICFDNIFTKGLTIKARNNIKGGGMLYHWFPNWMGWYSNNSTQNTEQDESLKSLEDDILNALEYSIENNSFSKRDAIFAHCKIVLLDGQILLKAEKDISSPNNAHMIMHFKKLSVFVETNPILTSYTLGISLGSICLIDKVNKSTEFQYLVKPQLEETITPSKSYLDFKNIFSKNSPPNETFFQLIFECTNKKDCRLNIKSKGLDIIYNRDAMKWFLMFVTKPYLTHCSNLTFASDDGTSGKSSFLKNWEQLLTGHKDYSEKWSFEIEIFAPRIIFMEDYKDKNTLMVLMDFGKFEMLKNDYRKNNGGPLVNKNEDINSIDESYEDDDMYMTPCSTPPGSEKSSLESPDCNAVTTATKDIFINNDNEFKDAFHNRLYDKYVIYLTDLQVLVCKNQERWQASLKSSSNFHFLDKFNISLHLEQRTVFTADPEYPSVNLYGTLPKILVHANEKKINDFFNIMHPITKDEWIVTDNTKTININEPSGIDIINGTNPSGGIVLIQFSIGQLIVEIQSNEKSIAELQIVGARAGLNKRFEETNFTMSIHGLLLVDAIQSFGPDFELLAASHRHVGMDSMSGSLKHSAPCSPISPDSPDSSTPHRPTSPHTINNAIKNIENEKNFDGCENDESNALITIEIQNILAKDQKLVQIVNITFNNLDIIANQQTIIELMDFVKRAIIDHKIFKIKNNSIADCIDEEDRSFEETLDYSPKELNFDFFRLNILMLHTIKRGDYFVARKVGTLTMSEAKIRATIETNVCVAGSLGGIQVIDITPDGVNHQRIFSVGKDPLTDPPTMQKNALLSKLTNEMYLGTFEDEDYEQLNALNFKISWNEKSLLKVKVRMASVWYTHCPRFLRDVNVCVIQFQQSFRKFLTSIRNKATDMAKEIVQQIKDRQSEKRNFFKSDTLHILVDIIISSPVIVLPVSNESSDVLVANLGQITIYNKAPSASTSADDRINIIEGIYVTDEYAIQIRNINLFSLNVGERKELKITALPKANEFYSCKKDALAILHDTAVSIHISQGYEKVQLNADWIHNKTVCIEGSVTQILKVSLTRKQYQQLIKSIQNATNFSENKSSSTFHKTDSQGKMYGEPSMRNINSIEDTLKTTIKFSVPVFQIELQTQYNETIINIMFREFTSNLCINQDNRDLQIVLRSVLMEDLKSNLDSPFRNMINSANLINDIKKDLFSSSCPNLSSLNYHEPKMSASMPSNLNHDYDQFRNSEFSLKDKKCKKHSINNETDDNLVVYKSHSIVRNHKNGCDWRTFSHLVFNCLNLAVSVDRWFIIFDFFGLVSESDEFRNVDRTSSHDCTFNENIKNQLEVSIRSLNITLVRNEAELSKVNISNAVFIIIRDNILQSVKGSLGSIALYDLTNFGLFYKQKFATSGSKALSFFYERINYNHYTGNDKKLLDIDAHLSINMSSVIYVHTKRFLIELHLFLKELLQLQTPVIRKLKNTNRILSSIPLKLGLYIKVHSLVVMLPSSYACNLILMAELGKLHLTNSFHFSSETCIISKNCSTSEKDEILDVMYIDLVDINLSAAERVANVHKTCSHKKYTNIGNMNIQKRGDNFFKESFFLKLQVERNLSTETSHNCPEISVKATFSKLNAILNVQDYKLLRGLLSSNLGEDINDVYFKFSNNVCESIEKLNSLHRTWGPKSTVDVWNVLSITILLENVTILLTEQPIKHYELNPLSCIHFIKSSLEIDTFSDGSQDIDLISSNILIVDARTSSNETNTFKNILQASRKGNKSIENLVQAEVHCRKRLGSVKYTIMLNNMRLILMLDYLQSLKNYLQAEPVTEEPSSLLLASSLSNHYLGEMKAGKNLTTTTTSSSDKEVNETVEIVLNITDSEIILLEDFSRLDTNAIILKSTSVFSYKPNNKANPLVVNINHLEIFSCTLDAEDESALSIIDPCTLNIELRSNCLHFTIQKQLYIRLSYNDIKLFSQMLRCIPKQTQNKQSKTSKDMPSAMKSYGSDFETIAPLVAMGFNEGDCWLAMDQNNYKLNDAAIWLSQHTQSNREDLEFKIKSVMLNTNCLMICIIDDCMDADVPLLEFLFSHVSVKYRLRNKNFNDDESVEEVYSVEGNIETEVRIDYYNRRLSGWEPIAELWECSSTWSYLRNGLSDKHMFKLKLTSQQILKLNITSTFVELFQMVCNNWTRDYYNTSASTHTNTHINSICSGNEEKFMTSRRRSPFVPFALKNLIGAPLLFKPIFAQPGGLTCTEVNQRELLRNWLPVQPNDTVSFDFSHRTKLRHMDSHKLNLHQILVQIHGWTLIGPISIDKVGTFFRFSSVDSHYTKKTRIIFEISLVGSAQKLITVRSALSVINKLERPLYLKMKISDTSAIVPIKPDEQFSIPLQYVNSHMYIKHNSVERTKRNSDISLKSLEHDLDSDNEEIGFGTREISWTDCVSDSIQFLYTSYDLKKSIIFTFVNINKENFPYRENNIIGHTITLSAPLKMNNMLCCDLIYQINNNIKGRINSSGFVNIYTVNINESINLIITLDNYQLSGQLKIPMGHIGTVEPKLKLIDLHNRELSLRVSIQSFQGKGMEIFISAPIWIINKSGLPLIYKQEGTNNEASGQFEEHENARQVSPLMFSFSDTEGSPALEVRLGKMYGNNNAWCKSFSIHKDRMYRELKAENTKGCYVIGINIRRGRGIYSYTTFITLSPRFQLHNKTGQRLEFIQKCDISKFGEELNTNNIVAAPVNSNFPFHWPNWDHEPLLCVRLADLELCCWSKGIPINEVPSVYINIRNELSEMFFLRLEVISNAATFILLFTDARSLPPPIRIDNFSDVVINFSQSANNPMWHTPVRPQSSLAYVLDDPLGQQSLTIEAPGGNTAEFPIHKFDTAKSLTYPNFIYIAFQRTFTLHQIDDEHLNSENHELVLGVKDKRVVIMKKNSGDRSQLWLMNSNGQLEHEGSSPPTQSNDVNAIRLVLDLERPPNPTEYTNLVVRPPNKQRLTTQTWRFQESRLMCHANMCVQSRDGLCGLRPGCEAVIGRTEPKSWVANSIDVPFEQCIVPQKLRPGSGRLEITTKMDGPICAIQVCDIKNKQENISLQSDPQWNHASLYNKVCTEKNKKDIVEDHSISFELPKGIGISIVTRKPCEELAYITLENITGDIISTQHEKSIDLKIFYLQIDNQLTDATCPVVFFSCKPNEDEVFKSALNLKVKILPSPNENAVIFKYLIFELKPCSAYLEEKLILKIAYFLGFGRVKNKRSDNFLESNEMNEFLLKNSRRFYFENLNIGPSQVRLSVITSAKLPYELLETKKALGLTLIKFEDAMIEFDKFSDKHHFETLDVYISAIKMHYINQVKWHAASILGSVDFLGNPLGFANDLSEGVSGLIFEGSVKSLVKNVTHGISNSTAKLTETLSDSLGRVVLDDRDNETRQRILELQTNSSGGHLAAGLKGFGFGILGGVTSIVRHTYDGVQSDGMPGFLSGLGKGIVGTVTKPIIGVLDLASETANAVRETSRGSHRSTPDRKRLPRCVTGAPGDLLPSYSYRQSKGQQYLYLINRRNFTEKLISYEPNLYNDKDARLRLLVSTECVRIFSLCEGSPAIMFECHLSEVLSCHPLITNTGTTATSSSKVSPNFYIEISTNLPKITRPRIRCQTEQIAEEASRCVNYAKNVYDEREHSLSAF